ncbi:alanine acetyltransferase [Hymenobacter sedentarius]|uniref:Alanine acetyltransferase n=1 Tax=Hymenobacter sedentarius TaxID=1411621 RepID=A0A0U3SYW5_9BACT|nr:GNAT family protein [Hymenobacter sedentarius]ALW85747.1 alanine acetyltransferase [Hymenobacter sedentarius]
MLTVNFTPFPTLTTERLTLRQLTPADALALFELRADPRVMKFIPRPLAQSVADAVEYINVVNECASKNERLTWGIALRADASQIIGTIGYVSFQLENHRGTIGYMLHPGFQGKGMMSEAVAAILDYGFDVLNLHSIEAAVDPQNLASTQVLKRSGFVQEGHFKENEFWDGKYLDTLYFSLLRPGKR